jgi:CheY-specific phosphatase CheX
MLKTSLIHSTNFFAKEVLSSEVPLFESCSLEPSYCASIAISGEENYTIYVCIPRESLVKMAYLFLFEENPSEEILRDLIKEIGNLIVGKAKVIAANDHALHFDISTPTFVGNTVVATPSDFDINFEFENRIFSLIGEKIA